VLEPGSTIVKSYAVVNSSVDNGDNVISPSTPADPSTPVRPEELVHERVRRVMKLLPEVLNDERSEAVHDLRVWSRRLQQVLVTMFAGTAKDHADLLIRSLRRARRALSGWRDCDVVIALLQRRLRRLRDSDEKRAWQRVHVHLLNRRQKEIRRARRRLANRRLFTLGQRTEDLLAQWRLEREAGGGTAQADFIAIVSESIKAAYSNWQSALIRAVESSSQADTHGFRIRTKQLRYRVELARDLGDSELRSQLDWLKRLQDSLGRWHDRAELVRIATEALANADFLLNETRAASLLLRRAAREMALETAKVKSVLTVVVESGESRVLETWIANHVGRADSADAGRLDRESANTEPLASEQDVGRG
jgi:CHAD domain-containing protein